MRRREKSWRVLNGCDLFLYLMGIIDSFRSSLGLFFGDIAVFSVDDLNPAFPEGVRVDDALDYLGFEMLRFSVDPPELFLHQFHFLLVLPGVVH